jgi:hypothetical protein
MHTECSAGLVGFAPSKSQKVLAVFDGERMTSGGRALPLCATDRQIRMIERSAGCFTHYHAADLGR